MSNQKCDSELVSCFVIVLLGILFVSCFVIGPVYLAIKNSREDKTEMKRLHESWGIGTPLSPEKKHSGVAAETASELEVAPEPTPEPTVALPPQEVIALMADPECVRTIVRFMDGLTATPNGALSYQNNQIVFRRERARYTIYNASETSFPSLEPWLSFWERLEGTTAEEAVITYTDHGVDGIVDSGVGHSMWRHFVNDRPPEIGLEHWPFWQESYRAAVDATVAQFNLKCTAP